MPVSFPQEARTASHTAVEVRTISPRPVHLIHLIKGGTADIAALREKGRLILVNRLASADREAIAQALARCSVKSISKSPDEKIPDVVAALEQLADELGSWPWQSMRD